MSLKAILMVHNVSAGKLKLDLIPKPKEEVAVSGDRVADFKAWLERIERKKILVKSRSDRNQLIITFPE